MTPTVFVVGDDRLLILRCNTEKEAGHAWTCLEGLAAAYGVTAESVHIWVRTDYEFMSAPKLFRRLDQQENEGRDGSQSSAPTAD